MTNIVEFTVRSKDQSKSGTDSMRKNIEGVGDEAESTAKRTASSFSGIGSTMASAGKAAGAVAGVAIGGAITVGIAKSLEFDTAQKKLEAQLGTTGPLAKDAGEVAGKLYAGAWGASMGEVSDAVATVIQSGAVMEDATTEQLEAVTAQALALAQTFDTDVAGSMLAVSRMVATKMVPDATAGLDLITRAFQQLGPGAEDVLDTFREYSGQFQKIGLDGPEALGLIQQMMNAGARSTDLAADALKEFSIRAIDGSKLTADSFQALGLDATEMSQKLAAGGQTADDAFALVVERLKGVSDPVAQSAVAVGLFGTQAEDLGAALLAINPERAVQGLGNVAGAAQKMADTVGGDAQSKITSMQRSMEMLLASVVNAPGILGGAGTAVVAFGQVALSMSSQVALLALALPDGFKKAALAAVASSAQQVAAAVASAAAWAVANAAMLLGIGGIILLIAGLIAAVVLVIKHWDFVKQKTGEVWDWIWDKITAVVRFIVDLFTNFTLVGIIISHWNAIQQKTQEVWDWISGFIGRHKDLILSILTTIARTGLAILTGGLSELVIMVVQNWDKIIGFFQALPGRILGFLSGLVDSMVDIGRGIVDGIWKGIQAGWNWLMDKVRNLARSLLDAAKSALGISSPSTAFEDEFGAEIPPGAGRGVDKTADVARRAARNMALGMLGQSGNRQGTSVATAASMRAEIEQRLAPIVLQFRTGGTPVEEFLAELIRNYVHVQGGDVQQVFGR